MGDKFEYNVLMAPMVDDVAPLDALGADGWELVAVKHAYQGQCLYYFKRRKS